jgi:lysophospholipase L1-like esterase
MSAMLQALTAVSTLDGSELAYLIQSGADKKATLDQLAARVKSAQSNRLLAVLGDSITAAGNSSSATLQTTGQNGYSAWLQILSNGRCYIPPSYNKGVIGETTTAIASRVSQITSLSPKPRACIVMGGTNNATGSVTIAQGKTDLAAIAGALIDANIIPIFMSPPPIDDSQAGGTPQNVRDHLHELANHMRYLADTVDGIHFIDANRKLITINDGKPISGYLYDGKHPGNYAARLMGDAATAVINTIYPPRSIVKSNNNDLASTTNTRGALNSNPALTANPGSAFSGTNYSGTVPDSWSMFTNFTANPGIAISQYTDSEGKSWLQFLFSGTGTSADAAINLYQFLSAGQYGRIASGDSVKVVAEVAVAKDGSNPISNLYLPNIYAQLNWSAGSVAASVLDSPGLIHASETGWQGVMESPVITAGAALTGASVYCKMRAANGTTVPISGIIRVRGLELRKV